MREAGDVIRVCWNTAASGASSGSVEDAALLHEVHGEGGDASAALEPLTSLPSGISGLACRHATGPVMVRKCDVFEALARHVPVGKLVAHGLVLQGRTVVQLDLAGELEDVLDADADATADGVAFVHQRRQRHLPAFTDGT